MSDFKLIERQEGPLQLKYKLTSDFMQLQLKSNKTEQQLLAVSLALYEVLFDEVKQGGTIWVHYPNGDVEQLDLI